MKHIPRDKTTMYTYVRILTLCILSLLGILSCNKHDIEDLETSNTRDSEVPSAQSVQERSNTLVSALSRHIIHCGIRESNNLRALANSHGAGISEDSLQKEAEQVVKLLALQAMYFEGEQAPQGKLIYPQSVKDSLIYLSEIAFDPDEQLLLDHIESYSHSSIFASYSKAVQEEVLAKMEITRKLRRTIVRICDEKELEALRRSIGLKMSPGDRMIWSEIAKQMTPCQRDIAMEMNLAGIGLGLHQSIFDIPHIVHLIMRYAKARHCHLPGLPFHGGRSDGPGPHKGKVEFPSSDPRMRGGQPHDPSKPFGPPPHPGKQKPSHDNQPSKPDRPSTQNP